MSFKLNYPFCSALIKANEEKSRDVLFLKTEPLSGYILGLMFPLHFQSYVITVLVTINLCNSSPDTMQDFG